MDRKKRLIINKIINCKDEHELQIYYSMICNDLDFDYGYLLDIIEFKLRKMSYYFHTHNIVVNEDWYGTLCDRAISILHAGYKTNIILSKDLGEIKVNTRNIDRFFNKSEINFLKRDKLAPYWLATVREKKACSLFWKFLHHYIRYLWD